MSAISGLATAITVSQETSTDLTTPLTAVLAIVAANVEQSYAFAANTKQFRIFNDGKYVAKLSYQATESGTNYYPIYPGDEHRVSSIIAANVIIYVQSPGIINLHLESWT